MFLKIWRLQHRCFPMNIAKNIYRTSANGCVWINWSFNWTIYILLLFSFCFIIFFKIKKKLLSDKIAIRFMSSFLNLLNFLWNLKWNPARYCSLENLYLTDSCEGRLSKERQSYFFDIRVVNKIVELKYKGIIVRIIAPW